MRKPRNLIFIVDTMGVIKQQNGLVEVKHVISDVDGVLRDTSRLANAATRMMFGRIGVSHDMGHETEWRIRGLEGYDSGVSPLSALLALNRAGENPRALLAMSDAKTRVDALVKEHITPQDLERLAELYKIGIAFFNSPQVAGMVEEIQGVRVAMQSLSANGYEISVDSNSTRESLIRDLSNIGVIEYIDIIIARDDVTRLKPAPEGILSAVTRSPIDATYTAYVGDKYEDMIAARRAGVISVGVTSGQNTRTQLEVAKPDFIFADFGEFASELIASKRTHRDRQPV